MLKDFVFTIKGKITIIIFFLILLVAFFSGFIFYQNKLIEHKTIMLNKHAEPTITLTFVSILSLVSARGEFNKLVFTKDSSKTSFYLHINELKGTLKSIKSHCDTLGMLDTNKVYEKTFKTLQTYEDNFNTINKIIYDYKLNQKRSEIAIDTILKNKQAELENPSYWNSYSTIFQYFYTYAYIKDVLMEDLLNITKRIVWVIILMSVLIIIIALLLWGNIYKYVSNSIDFIVNHLKIVSTGELLIEKTTKKDEIAQVLTASNRLVSNLNQARDFAISVGKGELNQNFKPASENDILGKSLISMRDELWKFKNEDAKRFWANKGLAKFADVMRENNQNVSILADAFLSELVNYIEANQGSVFIVEKNNSHNVQLKMIACYAYDKKKHIEFVIEDGEGIVGQIYKEKETIYLKEIPSDYIKITSGLGEALPTVLLVVPIKIENEVLGILEVTSFDEIEKHKIEFIETICANLASVLQTVSNAEKMTIVLDELKIKSEQMQSQEEELRQNMEELMATQEELQRKDAKNEKLIESLKQEIESLKSKN